MADLELERWQVGDLSIDVGAHAVVRGGERIDLPQISFRFLLALVRAAPRLLSADELMEQVWAGVFVNAETVTQRAKLLRDALGDDPRRPRYFAVRRGAGYQLIPPAVRADRGTGPAKRRSQPVVLAAAALGLAAVVGLGAVAPWRGAEQRAVAASLRVAVPSPPLSISTPTIRRLPGRWRRRLRHRAIRRAPCSPSIAATGARRARPRWGRAGSCSINIRTGCGRNRSATTPCIRASSTAPFGRSISATASTPLHPAVTNLQQYTVAPMHGHLLLAGGRAAEGRRLLAQAIEWIDEHPKLGIAGVARIKAAALMLLGERDQALSVLTASVRAGHDIRHWWYMVGGDPV